MGAHGQSHIDSLFRSRIGIMLHICLLIRCLLKEKIDGQKLRKLHIPVDRLLEARRCASGFSLD